MDTIVSITLIIFVGVIGGGAAFYTYRNGRAKGVTR